MGRIKSWIRPAQNALVVAAVATSLGVVVVAANAPADAVPNAAAPQAEAPLTDDSASARAVATGEPVVVEADTTETSQVTANPDGTFTSTTSREPVRVNQGGAWEPIDPTLRTATDNTLVPVASAADIAFSAGGTGPAVTVVDGAHKLSLTWPTALPAPTVDGSTATYASVLPGVDLALTAEADSYSEVLVVHDASAATNPKLDTLKLTATATDLQVTAAPDGGLTATDADGNEVFHGTRPLMWDSSRDPGTATAPTVDDPAGGNTTNLDMTVSNMSASGTSDSAPLTVTVPADALADPNVTYPVYIDPSIAESENYYEVLSNDSGEYYYNTGGQLKVGACPASNDPSCGGTAFETRSYFQIKTQDLVNRATTAQIYQVNLGVYETHSASGCTAEPVQLWASGALSSTDKWGGPSQHEIQEVSSARGDNCSSQPAGDVNFSNATLANYVQTAANNDDAVINFALKAQDDSSQAQWKRFSSNPVLTVHYDYPPSTPTGLTVTPNVSCPGKPVYTNVTTPKLWAKATDNNPSPLQVILSFATQVPGGANHQSSPGITAPSNTLAGWTVPNVLPQGGYYFVSAAHSDSTDTTSPSDPQGQAASDTSPPFYYTVDSTLPDAPSIDSFDYPQNAWGAPQGAQGVITLTSSSDAAGFAYAYDTTTVPSVTSTTCSYSSAGLATANSGSAHITAPSTLTPGPHTLYVKAFDDAHNTTGLASYQFYVAPAIPGEGATRIEAESLPVSAPTCDTNDANLNCNGLTNDPTFNEPLGTASGGAEERLIVPNAGASSTTSTPQDFTYTIQTPITGDYALGVRLVTQNHFGKLSFKLDGTPIALNGAPLQVDTYSPTPGTRYVQLGAIGSTPDPTNPSQSVGTHTLTVEVHGHNAASADFVYNGTYGSGANAVTLSNVHDGGESAAIDFFTVVPLNQAKFKTITDAMNNHGIAVDGTTAANLGPATNSYALSQSALSRAVPQSLAAGATANIDGVNFVMPSASSSGYDNVIADGQTIDLPSPVTASTVDLLALATCGQTASSEGGNGSNQTVQLGVNFDDGTYSSSPLPAVPDWLSGSSAPVGTDTGITLAATLPYFDAGTTKNTSSQPRIFHLSIPTQNTAAKVTSIVLPNLGSNFTSACTTPTLHILSIATG